jgi:hypothetical protein
MSDNVTTPADSSLSTFHFFPPAPEEGRAFFMQLLGAVLSLTVIGVLAFKTAEPGLSGVLIGAGIGVVFLIGRNAWQLEQKAARAQWSEIAIEENSGEALGFSFTNPKNQTQFVAWQQIETLEVRGGRLYLAWRDEKNQNYELQFGAREIENGMELIRLIAARGASTPAPGENFTPPSNFIPLKPK